MTTKITLTHRCKFDHRAKNAHLPVCPLNYELCHSPCDLLVTDVHGQIQAIVDTPDRYFYVNGELVRKGRKYVHY